MQKVSNKKIDVRKLIVGLGALLLGFVFGFFLVMYLFGGFPMSETDARNYWTKNNDWMKDFVSKVERGQKISDAEIIKTADDHHIFSIFISASGDKPYVGFIFKLTAIDNMIGVVYTKSFDPARPKEDDPKDVLWSDWAKPLEENWWLVKGT